MKKFLRWLFTTKPTTADVGLLTLRASVGLMMALAHGVPKIRNLDAFVDKVDKLNLPEAQVLGIAAALAEFLGGIFMALGLFTRAAALAVLATMVAIVVHVHGADPFAKQELALIYGLGTLAVLIAGPGRVSLDHLFFGRVKVIRPLPAPKEPVAPTPPPSAPPRQLADLLEPEEEEGQEGKGGASKSEGDKA